MHKLIMLAGLVLIAFVAPVRADDGIEREARELAEAAGPVLRKAGHTAVEIAPPKWTDGRAVEAAPGLVEAFAGGLARDGFTVAAGAKAKLIVTLEAVKDPDTDQPAVRLRASLNINGQVREVGMRLLAGEETLARLYAPPSVALDPKTPERDRVPFLTGSAKPAAPAAQPKVGFEMLIRDRDGTFRARSPVAGKVTVKELECYVIKFFNKETDLDFAVPFTIDGIPWDGYAEGEDATAPKGRMILVKANSEVTVRGWYASPSKSLAFDVLALPSFAAASKGEVGVIATQWFPAWAKNATPPAGEERAISHRSVLGTGAIRAQEDKFASEERVIGRLRLCLSVRYGR